MCVAVPLFPVMDTVVTPLASTQAAASTVSLVDPLCDINIQISLPGVSLPVV